MWKRSLSSWWPLSSYLASMSSCSLYLASCPQIYHSGKRKHCISKLKLSPKFSCTLLWHQAGQDSMIPRLHQPGQVEGSIAQSGKPNSVSNSLASPLSSCLGGDVSLLPALLLWKTFKHSSSINHPAWSLEFLGAFHPSPTALGLQYIFERARKSHSLICI